MSDVMATALQHQLCVLSVMSVCCLACIETEPFTASHLIVEVQKCRLAADALFDCIGICILISIEQILCCICMLAAAEAVYSKSILHTQPSGLTIMTPISLPRQYTVAKNPLT